MECKFCGRELEDDAVYCFYCGKRLDGKKPCPSCKALLPEDAIFCGKCGTRVVPEVLPDGPLKEKEEAPEKTAAESEEQTVQPEDGVTESEEQAEQTDRTEQSEESEENETAQAEEVTGSEVQEDGSSAEEPPAHGVKWKKAVEITGLCLAGLAALVGFIFTFCIGVAVTSDGQTDVFIYDYFGKVYENLDRIIVSNNLGDTQSFALYMPYIFGTLIAVAALICNFVFTIMTVISLVRQYAYKNEKADFIKPALRTFISYAVFATTFFALNVESRHSPDGINFSVYFNDVTLAALIIGGVAFGGYFACRVVLRLADFTDKKEIIKSSVSLGTGAIGVISAILLPMAVCRFSTATVSYSLGFMSIVFKSAFDLTDSTNCGGVMCFGIIAFAVQIALIVLTVCVIIRVCTRVGSGSGLGKKPLGAAIAAAVLSILYFLGAFAAANMLNAEAASGSVTRSYGVPITVIVLSFIMLGGIIAAIVLDKKFNKRSA